MTLESEFFELSTLIKEFINLRFGLAALAWDMRTYMPSAGIDQRSDVIALLGRIGHEKLTQPKVGEILTHLHHHRFQLNPIQQREIELIQREYDRRTKVPAELIVKLSKQSMMTEHLWQTAKKDSNFSLVQKDLEILVNLYKDLARYVNPDKDPWDVLGDLYEPNVSARDITEFFNPMKKGIIKLIDRYDTAMRNCDDVPSSTLMNFSASIDQQKTLTQYLIDLLGMDRTRFRVDESAHPFTTGWLDDVRITTHYLEGQPLAAFYSTMHEIGHSLYDLNLPRQNSGQFVGQSISAGIHESQSRYIENLVGKHPAFLRFIFPKLQSFFPPLKDATESQFIRAVNAIMPSKIRIYADEITYSLHIILRFEIERDLFAEKIQVTELPQIWNEKMEDYFHLKIENDAEGLLQDMHWYTGMFGYFPDYALGNLYNSQMLEIMRHDVPEWEMAIGNGNIRPVIEWLNAKVHAVGNLYDPLNFIEKLTGEKLNPHYFLDYAEMKLSKIFEI